MGANSDCCVRVGTDSHWAFAGEKSEVDVCYD